MQADRPTIAFELMPELSLVVFYKAARAATYEEWDAYLDFSKSTLSHGDRLRFLIYNADGDVPRLYQSRLGELYRGYSHRVAVLSESAIMRFIVSMFMLMNRRMRFFAPTQLEEAHEHLGTPREARPAIERTLERLRQRVEGVSHDAARAAAG